MSFTRLLRLVEWNAGSDYADAFYSRPDFTVNCKTSGGRLYNSLIARGILGIRCRI